MRPAPTELEARRLALEAELGGPVTLDALTGEFVLFQRRRGHRHSTDDLLTAWYAVVNAPPHVGTALDLGSGVGSVGLAVASRFGAADVVAVEVQEVSFRLLVANVWANGVADRVRTIHGDLREFIAPHAFDLVTGSPPYFDVSAGIVSADSQRAAARFELHGDVGDYCRAARAALAAAGRFVFCFPTVQRARAERAANDGGLRLLAACDVVPRAGLAPLFTLFVCARDDAPPADSRYVDSNYRHAEPVARGDRSADRIAGHPLDPLTATLTVRDAAGVHTPEMNAARAVLGLGPLATKD